MHEQAPITVPSSMATDNQATPHIRMPIFRPLVGKERIAFGGHREYEECERNRAFLLWQVETGQISALDAEYNDRLPGEDYRPWCFGLLDQVPAFVPTFMPSGRIEKCDGLLDIEMQQDDDRDVDMDDVSEIAQQDDVGQVDEGETSFDSQTTMESQDDEPGFCENPGSGPTVLAETLFATPNPTALQAEASKKHPISFPVEPPTKRAKIRPKATGHVSPYFPGPQTINRKRHTTYIETNVSSTPFSQQAEQIDPTSSASGEPVLHTSDHQSQLYHYAASIRSDPTSQPSTSSTNTSDNER